MVVVLLISSIQKGIKATHEKEVEESFQEGQISIVREQTQKGVLFYINNNTIQGITLDQLCEGGNG